MTEKRNDRMRTQKDMSWTIGRKLIAGFMVVIILAIIVGATGLIAMNMVKTEVGTTTTFAARKEILANLINISLLEARRQEKNFLMRYKIQGIEEAKTEYVPLVSAQVKAIHDYVTEGAALERQHGNEEEASRFEQIGALAESYEAEFLRAVEMVAQRGHVDTGLEGEFRSKIHEIEDLVAEKSLDTLTIQMLTIRRHEKDYLLRGEQTYIDQVERSVAKFKQSVTVISSTQLSQADKSRLTTLADEYLALFQQLTQVDVELAAAIENSRNAARSVDPLLDQLQAEASSDFQQSIANTDQVITTATLAEVLTLIVAVVAGAATAFLLSRSISHPIRELTQAAAVIAAGDLSRQAEVASKDEIGLLADAFNQMVHDLRQVIADIVRVSEKLAEGELSVRPAGDYRGDFLKIKNALEASLTRLDREVIADIVCISERLAEGDLRAQPAADYRGDFLKIKKSLETALARLNSTIQQTNLVVGQVAVAVGQVQRISQDLAANSEEQSGAVEQVTANLEETDAQVSSNAESARIANQLTHEATNLARAGQEKMGAMTNAMDAIACSSQEIGRIIKVIDEIAFQTNLLALNAAVEAARAGQYGRGFAVVAQEVRNLAGRSAKAAKETAELIAGATRQVQDGVKIAAETAGSLTEIVQNVVKVKDLVSEVAAASNEQTRGITEISNAMTQVNLGAQSTSQQSEELAATAVELGNIVERLREETGRFKLSEAHQAQGMLLPDELSPETLQQIIKLVREQKAAKAPTHTEKPSRAGGGSRLVLDRDERGYEDF
jgi:methyl-accepting chemotaxis protein